MTANNLLSYYNNLRNHKEERISLMLDVNSFFSPDDKTYTGESKIGFTSVEKGELLDTTGSDLLQEFVSYALGLFFDTDRRWFTIQMEGYEENFEVKKALETRSDILFKCIGRTNYYAEASNYEWDCLVHGHALMSIEQDNKTFAECRAKNPTYTYFSQDTNGNIRDVLWAEDYSYMDVLREFPSFKLKLQELNFEKDIDKHFGEVDRSLEIISIYMKVDKNVMSPEQYEKWKKYKYIRRYIFDTSGLKLKEDTRAVEFDRFEGFDEPVLFPVRDERTREHPYGEGKGKIVLPKARMLNKLSHDMLNLSALKANPPLMMTADLAREMGLIGRNKRVRYGFKQNLPIQPGSVYIFDREKLEETGGRGPVQVLDVSGKLEETVNLYQNIREQTAELLPIAGQVYKVARQSISEIQQRTEQQSKRLGPIRANYAKEGLAGHLRRFYNLAEKAGKFTDIPIPKEAEGREMKFVFDSFLLQTKRISDSLRLSQSLNIVSQFMLAKPSMADWINGNKIMQSVFESNGVLKYLLDGEAVQAQRQQTQAEAQRQAQLQQTQVDGSVIKATSDALSTYAQSTGEG